MADNIVINVIAVSPEVTKMNKAGKPYGEIEVTYKDVQNRVGNKKLLSFQAQQVYDTFKAAKNGDVFEVETVKNGDYRNWTRATPTTAGATQQGSNNQKVQTQTNQAQTRSNYETPEERAARQVMIVKQSSLSNAVSTVEAAKGAAKMDLTTTAQTVLGIAQQYTDWVLGIADEPAKSIKKDALEQEFDNDVPN